VAMLLDHLGVHDRRSLLDRVYDPPIPREEVAALAGLVGRVAEQGDPQAGAILHQAGDDLGNAAGDLAVALGLHDGVLRVATLGGVFRAGPLVLDPFTRRLRSVAPGAEVVPARFPPVIGALILAYRAAGLEVDAALLNHVTASWHRYERA
jgi:N-acetylglucosamine kinase-like BadF-type ATPase